MAKQPTITQEQVNATADALRDSGAKPTARAVRGQLGVGSMATVLKMLHVWQRGQVSPPSQDVTLPKTLTRALTEFVQQERESIRASFGADLGNARQEQADLIAESERQEMLIANLGEENEKLRQEASELAGKVKQLEHELSASRTDAAQARSSAENIGAELHKASLRIESVVRIENDMASLREAHLAEQKARIDAEQRAAVLESKIAYELSLREKAESALVDQVRVAEDALRRSVSCAEALGHERVAVQAAQARLESAARELEDARKSVAKYREEAKEANEKAAELRGMMGRGRTGSAVP